MSEPIRIGIVGLGWVSTHRHIPAIRRDPRFAIAGVADRKPALAAEWGRRLGVPHCAAERVSDIDWLELSDALDIATAPMSHYPLAAAALDRGKHVITEKPFAMQSLEGRDLVDRAKAANRILAVVHNFQFASALRRLETDISEDRIGKVRSIVATQWGNPARRLPSWYDSLPGGLFYDESPHLLYLLRRLAPGALRMVSADACPSTLGHRTPASIDVAWRAEFPHGDIPVTMQCRFEAPLSEWHVAVLGDKAVGVVDVFRNIYIRIPNDGAHRARQVLTTSLAATIGHWWQHFTNGPLHLSGRLLYGNETVFQRFADSILSGNSPMDVSSMDAIQVLNMQWEILESCKKSLAMDN